MVIYDIVIKCSETGIANLELPSYSEGPSWNPKLLPHILTEVDGPPVTQEEITPIH